MMKISKKEQIEQTAMELFWKHGFKKVSIDEICKKASVSRKTFYTFYDNKNAIVIFLLNRFFDNSLNQFKEVFENEWPLEKKLERIIELKLEINEGISFEFISDFHTQDSPELLECYKAVMDKLSQILIEFIRKTQEKGEINANLNADFILWYFQKLTDLCLTDEIVYFFPNAAIMTQQLIKTFIFGIMPGK